LREIAKAQIIACMWAVCFSNWCTG